MRFLAMFILCALVVVMIPGPLFARETVINAVGDIMLAGSGTATLKKKGYAYPFAAAMAELRKGNISIGDERVARR
jgi:hypothetical protein